jgi:hypothetical protein
VQAWMSTKEWPGAARRRLDGGVSKGATGSFPMPASTGTATPAPAPAERAGFGGLIRRIFGGPEAR